MRFKEKSHGPVDFDAASTFYPQLLGAAGPLPEPDGVKMTLFYWLVGLIMLALLIYLVFGLLKPEWFE
jgi:K+-transporting ATPase KdpF subunit